MINPHQKYLVKRNATYGLISNMSIFEKVQEDELMFIAMNLKTKVCMLHEKVIIQGDFTTDVFFILSGTVDVKIQENSIEDLMEKNKSL